MTRAEEPPRSEDKKEDIEDGNVPQNSEDEEQDEENEVVEDFDDEGKLFF